MRERTSCARRLSRQILESDQSCDARSGKLNQQTSRLDYANFGLDLFSVSPFFTLSPRTNKPHDMAGPPSQQGTESLLPGAAENPLTGTGKDSAQAPVQRIQQLLKAKDDTSRFVGLALLKSVLDNTPEIRQDGEMVYRLWGSIPTKFLDRLIRTGTTASQKDAREMLDLAVSVVHTFTLLLPEEQRRDVRLLGKIPLLTSALLPRYAVCLPERMPFSTCSRFLSG